MSRGELAIETEIMASKYIYLVAITMVTLHDLVYMTVHPGEGDVSEINSGQIEHQQTTTP